MEALSLAGDLTIVLSAALVGGVIAHYLKMPAIVGYILGGIAVGPFGLSLVHDQMAISTLADIGIVLLMFASGTQFSLRELRRGGRTTLIGGTLQILITAGLGFFIVWALNWPFKPAFFFGLLIAQSSTAVIVKTLIERGEMESLHGRITIGISLYQDITTVFILVLLATLGEPEAGSWSIVQALGLAGLKAALFIVVALALGSWLLPRILGKIAALGSRELRLVSVLILSLGVALGTAAAGLSPGLGAFAAGLILSESDYAFQALADVTPLRDTLTILFFVSVGMLIDPAYVRESLPVLAFVIPAVMVGKFFIANAIILNGGYQAHTATLVGLSLLPISEFSFVLAKVGLDKRVIDQSAYSLILTTAMVSILTAPLLFTAVAALHRRFSRAVAIPEFDKARYWLSNHVVICGHGRIGRDLVEVLRQQRLPYLVIDLDPKVVARMRAQGEPCLYGDASHPEVLAQAQLAAAKVLVITYSDPVATEMVVQQAKKINPDLEVVARVYRDSDAEHFRSLGVTELVRLDLEEAKDVINFTLHKLGISGLEIRDILDRLRTRA